MPTEVSGIEVMRPRIKKDIANEDIFSDFANLSTLLIISPAPNHNVIKEQIYKRIETISRKKMITITSVTKITTNS